MSENLFAKHKATLDGALKAIHSRDYFSPWSRTRVLAPMVKPPLKTERSRSRLI